MPCDFIVDYYVQVRNALFMSGFTIGAFLFSMKTFILKTMKDDYYDKEEYHEKIKKRQAYEKDVKVYQPLRNFSNLLLMSIVISFLSAFSQFSVGFIPHYIASIFCLSIAVVSWYLVGKSIYYVGQNWGMVLDLAEEKVDK